MKLASLLALAALAAGTAAGCGDDDAVERPAADAGGAPRDAGERDDGGPLVWTPPDAGDRDAADDPDAIAPPRDSGTAERVCERPRRPVAAALLPRCSAATRDCIAGCPTAADPDACRDGCLEADLTPPNGAFPIDCAACVYLQLFACIDQADCHDAVADAFCCFEDRCPPGSAEGCNEQMCSRELRTAITCGYYADMSCLDFLDNRVAECFPPEGDGSDAGTE
jgi:hypothetical protein